MSNNKKSSIEHLVNWMSKNEYFIGNDLLKEIKQAKEMHKQEIVEFTENYILECVTCSYDGVPNPLKEAEEYYNETYGGKDII
jgi:hypothetical protein